MRTNFAFALLFAAALPASAATPAPAAPAELSFNGESYVFVAREADAARVAEHYLRANETLDRFSRRLTVADHPQATSAKAQALGVVKIATLRTPGLTPDTFIDDEAPGHDVSVVWYDLTDDSTAVEYHVARFVDLAQGGVREYHYTARRYTNNLPPDGALASLRRAQDTGMLHDVEMLSALDRAPQHPPADAKPKKKS